MRSWDKEVEQSLLYDEKAVIKSLEKNYQSALKEVDDRIGSFAARISSGDNVQSAIYQMRYQQELKKQIEKSLENLQNNNYSTITDYLQSTYKNGFMGAQYTLHKQGIPLITPINQQSIVQALTLNSKISTGLYNRLGVDVEQFKHIITTEVSRGIATGSSWKQIAKQISNKGNVTFSNASRIARTEGHRIQSEAKIDAYTSAKTKGADIVKQWDSTLDGKTRDTHRKLDGQIRELDEDFEVNGMTVSAPGHFGDPAEDCNCRCCLLQRARWALDAEELKTLQDRAEYFGLDKSKDFEDFKDKYINAVANANESDIIKTASNSHSRNAELEKLINSSIKTEKPVFAEDLKNNFLKIKPIEGKYILALHGDNQFAYLNNIRIDERILANIIKSREDYNGEPVILISCNTGNDEGTKECFAQKLANELGVPVQAPTRYGAIDGKGNFYSSTRTGLKKAGEFKTFNPRHKRE